MKFALLVCFLVSPAVAGRSFDRIFPAPLHKTFVECVTYFMPKWIPKENDIDAMQALQRSISVTAAGFEKGKQAAKKVNQLINQLTANGIRGDVSGSRSGFILFGGSTELKIHLSDHDNLNDLNADIESQVYNPGASFAIAKALELASREFDDNSNALRNKLVMLITDGNQNVDARLLQAANELKEKHGAHICVITVGDNPNMELLTNVASSYGRLYCICGTKTWDKLKINIKKVLKELKPVIIFRRQNKRKQLKQV